MRPSYDVEDPLGTSFAAANRRGRKRFDYVEAIGVTEAQAVRDLAALLRQWNVERVEE